MQFINSADWKRQEDGKIVNPKVKGYILIRGSWFVAFKEDGTKIGASMGFSKTYKMLMNEENS